MMSDFGSCTESCCRETSVRLFVCVHHCQKFVCLQHLIEHDQIIEQNENNRENLRNELKDLWAIYSSIVDESKLRLQFESKLYRYQQFIREISSLFERNSTNIDNYQLMIDKIQLNIEQEKQTNQCTNEFLPQIDQVKAEQCDIISTYNEFDTLNVSLESRLQRTNSYVEQRDSISNDSSITNQSIEITHENANVASLPMILPGIQTLSCECPLWQNGAFGLREDIHGVYLCSPRQYAHIYGHLIHFHKLKMSCVERICRSIQLGKDPSKEILFQRTEIVIDEFNHHLCPFSIYNPKKNILLNTKKYSCRRLKPAAISRLRQHFIQQHRMSSLTAKQFVNKLQIQSKK